MPARKYHTNPNTTILGAALQPIAQNRNVADFTDLVHQYGYDRIDAETPYPLQDELNFMKDLASRWNSSENMIAIGVEVFESAVLPPNIRTIEDGIHLLNDIIHLNCANYSKDWEYTVETVARNKVHVTDNTPWPHDLIYGYLYGLCKKLLPKGTAFKVRRDYTDDRNPDNSGAHYEIKWEA